MTDDPRPLFAEFNRGVQRARRAYVDDKARAEGLCVRCGTRKAAWSRVCPPCAMKASRRKG